MATRDDGFSLLETIFAISILSVGALGMAGVFTKGMQGTTSSPSELTATQKAAEAIESVFSARDSHSISWNQLRNQNRGGIFKNYRLRVAAIVRDYGLKERAEAPQPPPENQN